MRPHPSYPRPLFLFRSPSWSEMLREMASAPDRTLVRDHYLFDRHTPVSIQMLDGLIEELSKDVFPLASLVLHSARKLPRPRRLTAAPTSRWFNGFAGHHPPGGAAVCGWGFLLLFLGIGLINLDWLGWMNFSRRALEKPAIT